MVVVEVSLIEGKPGLPVGNGLARDVDLFRQLLLRKRERGAVRFDLIAEFHKLPPVRFVRSAPKGSRNGIVCRAKLLYMREKPVSKVFDTGFFAQISAACQLFA